MAAILVSREQSPDEARVAATPETVHTLIQSGCRVLVERGAGDGSYFADAEYSEAGAELVDVGEAWSQADLVLRVRAPVGVDEPGVSDLGQGAGVVGFMSPHKNLELVRALAERKISALAMELVPRITRAQKMDALSSQANIAGYKAVLLAAAHLPKYFPMLMTAAGTVKPARVVIMGAGVAGLQAIATARRLGAVVEASDIRPAVKEQVQSLGATFIEPPELDAGSEDAGGYAREVSEETLRRQQETVAARLAQADVVITTALVPGRPAPLLVPEATVEAMKPGSVIVDLAVEQGGNCALSERGKAVRRHGVLILGEDNLPGSLPRDASMLYARNVLALVLHLLEGENKEELSYDLEDEVTRGTLLTHDGQVLHAPTAEALGLNPDEPDPAPDSGAGKKAEVAA